MPAPDAFAYVFALVYSASFAIYILLARWELDNLPSKVHWCIGKPLHSWRRAQRCVVVLAEVDDSAIDVEHYADMRSRVP
jgi:hypothetical protein